MRLIYFTLFLCSSLAVSISSAQESTMGDKDSETKEFIFRKGKVLLIPFDERMYFGEFDPEISKLEQLEFRQIRDKFRKAVDTALYLNLFADHGVNSLLRNSPDAQEDLKKIRSSVFLSYEEIPESATPKKELIKGKKSSHNSSDELKIKKGELTVISEEKQKYMAVVAENTQVLEELKEKYGSEIFVFINQFEIKRSGSPDYMRLEQNDYWKEVRIHYTIMNFSGERISSGVATNTLSSKETALRSYIKALRPVAALIAGGVPK
jgi:hypothetical protein